MSGPPFSGLFAFATTALVSSLYNVGARGVFKSEVIVGAALFVGGFGQFIAGMWDFVRGDTFGANGASCFPPPLLLCHH